jgi:ParB family chromosome partitioning protein
MSKDKPVLGRGLASLISKQGIPLPGPGPTHQDDGTSTGIIANVELHRIQKNPFQPRADFDPAALDQLTRSIKEKGVLQPITIRRIEGGYQLISGERRLRAARDAGLNRIPAYIIQVRSEEEMLELALIENLQREDLNPIEIAISYRRLLEECNYTQEEVASRVGKDRSTVTNFLRLLKLPEEIQHALRTGELTSGHGRALVAIDDGHLQLVVFKRILRDGLSVREVERIIRRPPGRRRSAQTGRNIAERSTLASVEERLRQLLGTKVQVRSLQHGRGEILIEYYSAEDLDRILDILEESKDHYR